MGIKRMSGTRAISNIHTELCKLSIMNFFMYCVTNESHLSKGPNGKIES